MLVCTANNVIENGWLITSASKSGYCMSVHAYEHACVCVCVCVCVTGPPLALAGTK